MFFKQNANADDAVIKIIKFTKGIFVLQHSIKIVTILFLFFFLTQNVHTDINGMHESYSYVFFKYFYSKSLKTFENIAKRGWNTKDFRILFIIVLALASLS